MSRSLDPCGNHNQVMCGICQNQIEFKKKLEAAASKYGQQFIINGVDRDKCASFDFSSGAQWSRQETLREVLEALRSDPLIDGRRLELEACHWADWLEVKFKERREQNE